MMKAILPASSRIETFLSNRKSQNVVHLSAKRELEGEFLPSGARTTKVTLPKLGLSRSYSTRPLGRTLLVKAEFVFADPGASDTVSLHGDWNGWTGVPLKEEEKDLWSCVVIVPTGHREFYFVVDGNSVLSSKHPISTCGTRNWRNIHGPHKSEPQKGTRTAFYIWAQKCLENLGLAAAPGDMDDILPSVFERMEQPATAKRRDSTWDKLREYGWGTMVVVVLSTYLVGSAMYNLLFVELIN